LAAWDVGAYQNVLSTPGAERFVPDTKSLSELAAAACQCQGCPLWADATQTVFGEGSRTAPLVLVGEQPGDQEDRQGLPFVGPAGRVLWQCVAEAGIDRSAVYVTNAVKHFKHTVQSTSRGKRRLHKKPNTAEIEACHPWIEAELRAVRARAVVALGATAARSLLGTNVAIATNRGVRFELDGRPLGVTYHPSAVLRADDRAIEIRSALVEDLRTVASWLET
jgi:uracil-DNA glycosylase